ncbi:hypothetical protein FRC08_000950 [Ceratobasidium sp. 394]|nr:hypothetical protein FRC08_000950 [Ceratobasidium sp. 394]
MAQVSPDETYPLQPLGPARRKPADTPLPTKARSWRSGVTKAVFALIFHAALGLTCCSAAISFTFYPDYRTLGWFSLYSFGRPLPLLTARYLNFGLDIFARVFSLTLELLSAFVALRTATALWSSSQGIRISDAIAFNFLELEVASIWATYQTKIPRRIKIGFIFSITCGIAVYLSGSLVFGYANQAVQEAGNRDVNMGGNQMFLGSNISGSYIGPDYSSLVPPGGSVSAFTTTVLHTLMDIDLSPSNLSISSFDLASESRASLLSRNITMLLVNQTISTQLTDCQPVPAPAAIPFGFNIENLLATYAEQNLSTAPETGPVHHLREDLYTDPSKLTTSKYQTYTFLMTHAGSTGATPTPVDESQVLVVQAYKSRCLPDPFETPFGPMPHAWIETPVIFRTNSTFFHSHSALACRNVRTISRVTYTPGGSQMEQTSHSFYAKPILSTLNRLYIYAPIMSVYESSEPLAQYGGIGSLLNKDMVHSSAWKLPGCEHSNSSAPVPSNSTELDAISAAWGRAVTRVQHYETLALQALVKQNTTVVSAPVLIAVPMYRLAVMPGALFIYGLSMTISAFLLMILLAKTGDGRESSWSTKSLSIFRVANELGVMREGESEDARAEEPESSLKKDLGMVVIRRHPRSAI